MTKLVAVYGSLREGLGNHRVLEDSERIGDGKLEGFNMYSLGAFPALVDGDNTIEVEVYEPTNQRVMDGLDRLEGYPHFYDRRVDQVTLENGNTVAAWVYFMHDKPSETVVESGDWKKYLTS